MSIGKSRKCLYLNDWQACHLKKRVQRVGAMEQSDSKKNNKGQIIPTQVALVDILVPTPFSSHTLTSLVFHRCLCAGKCSDLGKDSKLSGSFIGSPSGTEKKDNIRNSSLMLYQISII